jgi:hypothetical protein
LHSCSLAHFRAFSFSSLSRECRITKTIIRGSIADKQRLARLSKTDSLTALVASLTAKKQMSTLDKTRVDWDISKEEEGDAADLEKASKNGYVEKMAFLAKTDAKQFEIEKAGRERKRTQQERSNGAKAGGGGGGGGGSSAAYEEEDEPEEEETAAAVSEETKEATA